MIQGWLLKLAWWLAKSLYGALVSLLAHLILSLLTRTTASLNQSEFLLAGLAGAVISTVAFLPFLPGHWIREPFFTLSVFGLLTAIWIHGAFKAHSLAQPHDAQVTTSSSPRVEVKKRTRLY